MCPEVAVSSNIQNSSINFPAMVTKQLGLLTSLNLSKCNITDQGAEVVAAVIKKTISLAQFDLSNTTLNVARTNKVSNALKSLASLKSIIIHSNDIGDENADLIAAVTLNNPLLENLSAFNNKLSSTGLLQIVNALLVAKNIRMLDFCNNVITSDNIEELSKTLAEYPVLQELNLSQNLLMLDGVLRITQSFRHHPTLQNVNLSNNSVSFSSACEFIADVILSVNQELLYLNVSGRNIRPRFIEDYLSPPNHEKNVDKFTLQNLYLPQHVSLNTVDIQTKLIKVQSDHDPCPISYEDIISYYVDHTGGVFYNQYHNFALVIPPGAVSQGECVEIQATASHCGPYEIPDGFYPISSYFWFSADYTFKIPVYIIMSHYAKIRSLEDMNYLYVLQTNVCDSVTNGRKLIMKKVLKGVYFDCEIGYCVLATDHFCSYCPASVRQLPNYFSAAFYTYDDDSDGSHIAEVCFCPLNSHCQKVTKCINYSHSLCSYLCCLVTN